MELTAKNVNAMMEECLAMTEGYDGVITIEGIVNTFAFDEFWINENKENIRSMLLQLDDAFMDDGGQGWSFLNMPFRADGVQWGGQSNAEQLMVLGMACNLVVMLMPREMWSMMAGGVPYIQVKRVGDAV